MADRLTCLKGMVDMVTWLDMLDMMTCLEDVLDMRTCLKDMLDVRTCLKELKHMADMLKKLRGRGAFGAFDRLDDRRNVCTRETRGTQSGLLIADTQTHLHKHKWALG